MARPTTTTPTTSPRPTTTQPRPSGPRPNSPMGPKFVPQQRAGDPFALPAPVRSTEPPRAFGVSAWTCITPTVLPEPTAGARCAWCTTPTGTGLVIQSRLPYCDATCADLAMHACGDCGADTRKRPVEGPMPACHTAGAAWVANPDTEQQPVHVPTHMAVVPLARAGRGFDWAKNQRVTA